MAMTAKLFSISGLATELGRDRRTVGRALSHRPPDGKCEDGSDGWYLTTALRALGNGHGRGDDDALNALEDAAAAVDDLLDRLRAQPDVQKRRALLRSDGRVIGAFAETLERVRGGHSESQRMVEEPFCFKTIGDVISEALALCELMLEAA
jgi:hypothetical protein